MKLKFSDGAEVEIGTSESIVSELKQLGFMFPHSCEVGRCESCKVEVLRGETGNIYPEISLSEVERSHGFILACCRKALSNLEIQAPLPGLSRFRPRLIPCKLDGVVSLGDGLFQIEVQLPRVPIFNFVGGQHVEFILPDGSTRLYSIAGGHKLQNRLRFLIRAHDGGRFGEFIRSSGMEALFRLRGPLGALTLGPQGPRTDLVFVATGTGISVFRAMLEEMMVNEWNKCPYSITLFWGVSNESNFAMVDLEFYRGNLSVVKTVSKPSQAWLGNIGRVTDLLAESELSLSSKVFLCGNPDMVSDVRSILLRRGFKSDAIQSDAFVATDF